MSSVSEYLRLQASEQIRRVLPTPVSPTTTHLTHCGYWRKSPVPMPPEAASPYSSIRTAASSSRHDIKQTVITRDQTDLIQLSIRFLIKQWIWAVSNITKKPPLYQFTFNSLTWDNMCRWIMIPSSLKNCTEQPIQHLAPISDNAIAILANADTDPIFSVWLMLYQIITAQLPTRPHCGQCSRRSQPRRLCTSCDARHDHQLPCQKEKFQEIRKAQHNSVRHRPRRGGGCHGSTMYVATMASAQCVATR